MGGTSPKNNQYHRAFVLVGPSARRKQPLVVWRPFVCRGAALAVPRLLSRKPFTAMAPKKGARGKKACEIAAASAMQKADDARRASEVKSCLERLDLETPRKEVKRPGRVRSVDQAVQKLVRDHFGTLTSNEVNMTFVQGLNLYQTLTRDREANVSMGKLYYERLRK